MKYQLRPLPAFKFFSVLLLTLIGAQVPSFGQDSVRTVNHYVADVSSAPSMKGEIAQLYVREKTIGARTASEGRVVLFIHGAGTPAEVAFDVPYQGYSWMEYLARAGLDTFAMDTTGYGRSTRPYVMNDPCNMSQTQREQLIPELAETGCEPSYGFAATTIASDWDDIDAVVDYVRALRGVPKVHLVAWSLGGPRAAGYAALHPEKVDRLVLLAPAYSRSRSGEPPEQLPVAGAAFSKQSRSDFDTNWNRQIGCENQFDSEVAEAVWSSMLESDPVGATWGSGVRRAPRTTVWGWGQDKVAAATHPMLLVSPVHDQQISAQRVTELFEDLGSTDKVLLDLACSSHNAMWEKNHLLLFDASAQWLLEGVVDGQNSGTIRKGY
ncbi:MAG: alpha/beta hydrolase [Pseudohongiellaceae bacterium]